MDRLDRIKGCLLSRAVGDALGTPVELLGWADIKARFGDGGIRFCLGLRAEGGGNRSYAHDAVLG